MIFDEIDRPACRRCRVPDALAHPQMVVLKHLVPASLLGVVMLPTVRHLTTDFSSRQVECDRIQPRRRVLSKRSLSMKPSISSRIGFKPFARSR